MGTRFLLGMTKMFPNNVDYISQKSPRKQPIRYIGSKVYFKDLAYAVVEASKSKICRVAWRPRKKLILQLKEFEGSLLTEFTLWKSVFILLRPSTDWMNSTHVMENNLLSLESFDLHVNLI